MVYLFKVYALVAFVVFGLSGVVMLAMLGWSQVRDYTRARHAMLQIASRNLREPITISRGASRFHDGQSLRAS